MSEYKFVRQLGKGSQGVVNLYEKDKVLYVIKTINIDPKTNYL